MSPPPKERMESRFPASESFEPCRTRAPSSARSLLLYRDTIFLTNDEAVAGTRGIRDEVRLEETRAPNSAGEPEPPQLADESRWYTEHTALLISTLKWAFLGAVAGLCVGLGTKAFLWSLAASGELVRGIRMGPFPYYCLLPAALPACVWLIRTFAPTAKGHGTEAVIAAVHQRSGKIDWKVAPIKLLATVVTLAFGGSVGKEGPCAQIGAAIASLFADLLRLSDEDRRRLVICGIGGGFAAVFGTPISGALFGIEVLYLGRIEYSVLFPCLVSGIVAHLVCGVHAPVPEIHASLVALGKTEIVALAILFGAVFGIAALILIETMRGRRKGPASIREPSVPRRGRGRSLPGRFLRARRRRLREPRRRDDRGSSGRSGFDRASRLSLEDHRHRCHARDGRQRRHRHASLFHRRHVRRRTRASLSPSGRGICGVWLRCRRRRCREHADRGGGDGDRAPARATSASTRRLAAGTAFLIVGHRSVYASQKIGLSKSAGLDVRMDVSLGELTRRGLRIREGSLTERVLRRPRRSSKPKPGAPEP